MRAVCDVFRVRVVRDEPCVRSCGREIAPGAGLCLGSVSSCSCSVGLCLVYSSSFSILSLCAFYPLPCAVELQLWLRASFSQLSSLAIWLVLQLFQLPPPTLNMFFYSVGFAPFKHYRDAACTRVREGGRESCLNEFLSSPVSNAVLPTGEGTRYAQ